MPKYEDDSSAVIGGRRFRFNGIPKALWTAAGLRIGDDAVPAADLDVVNVGTLADVRIAAGASETTAWKIRANDSNGTLRFVDDNASTTPIVVENSTPTNTLYLDSAGGVGVAGVTAPATALHVGGAITLNQVSEPSDPAAGSIVLWTSNGTGFGDAGDWCLKSNVGGTVKSSVLFDYSAA